MESYPLFDSLQFLLTKGWEFFQLQVPGAPFTFGQLVTGTLVIYFSLHFLYIGFSVGDGNMEEGSGVFHSYGRGESSRPKYRHNYRQ